jgi:formylglycine-generating enzyme required for sulfatase activity
LVRDARGERSLGEADFPLTIGGAEVADIVVPNWPSQDVAAYIALSDGHVYIQPAEIAPPLYHNHERLGESAWLKSGDHVALGDAVVRWVVRGDQVSVDVGERASGAITRLVPPVTPPRTPLPDNPTVAAPPAASSGRRRLRFLISGVLTLLLIAALFVMAAAPVFISITPQPDQLGLSGFPPPVSIAGRHLMLPGLYKVSAQRDGYYPLREELEVGDNGYREFAFTLQPLPGRVTVSVDPESEFRLFVDGTEQPPNEQGQFEIRGGKRRLRVLTDRYLPEEREVEVDGFGRAQQVALVLRPAWADVEIDSEPAGAEVRIDGEVLGATPLKAQILEGLREVQYALPKHKTVTLQREIAAGQKLALDKVRLPPADGQLAISTQPSGATVSIDGDFHGRTPVNLALAANAEHRIRLIKGGYSAVDKTITLGPEEVQSLELTLTPVYGTLFLSTQPADAELFVDGKAFGSATRRLRLTARPHMLEIRKSGYKTHRMQVTPRAGVNRTVQVQLRTIAQADAGESPAGSPIRAPTRVTSRNGDALVLLRPRGPFSMGASRREAGRRANESRRQVALTRPYYLGVKEVTNAQFRRFRPAHSSGNALGTGLDGDNQPVVNLSWEEAARYCNWLSKQQGLPLAYKEKAGRLELVMPPNTGYRLPTEAEWAYAARIHGRTQPARYAWSGGFPPTTAVGNYADARVADTLADVILGYDDGFRGTAPVASFAASPSGLYDLGGNVAEWTNDYYTVYPAASGAPEPDPVGPTLGEHRVVRGSSWRHGNITELRLSYRDYSKTPRNDLGFRIARYAQ